MSLPIGVAVNVALEMLIQAQKVSLLVAGAQAENRDTLTPEETKQILEGRQAAFDKLDASISKAESERR